MEFTWTPEQQDLRASTRRLLQQRAPLTRARELAEAGTRHDPQLWTALAQQIGLQGLALPEEHGGSGGSRVELAVVFEEMGRALLAAPYFSTVALAANTLLVSGDDTKEA